METYLLKFSACLLVFWLLYVLVLERQTIHQFKRFYLLGSIALALTIPALTITEYVEPVVTDFEPAPMTLQLTDNHLNILQEQSPTLEPSTILWSIYGIIGLGFAIRFLVNLYKMKRHVSENKTITKHPFIYVLLTEYRIPHSFFKYIFLNKVKYETKSIPKEVLLHEETHAKQLHSIDILLLELLQIVFWFHPLIYILKHHIKLNHEFLADDAVLKQGVNTKNYQHILLKFSSSTSHHQLASAINYSSFKKRFTVMKTQTSKTRIWLSSLVLLPIIAILFYSFAETEYIEKEASQVSQLQNQSTNAGATEAMMQEYKDWIKKLNTDSSGLIIPVGTWERLAAIYDLMSEEQRNSVDTHPLLQEITPDLYSVKPSEPTTAQYESWHDEKEFTIWLDRKYISNSELNNYALNDIVHFTSSKVYNNARSEKFPQPFQINLYTKDGFNKFYKEAFINDYRGLTETYSNAIKDYLKGPQIDNSELRIIKAQADKLYGSFTKEEKEKHNILPAPPVPAEKQSSIKQSLNNSVNEVNSKQQTKTLTVLINRKDEFLINDERGSFESLEKLLKSIPDTKDYKLYFKTDKETSKEVTNKTFVLLKKYDILKTANEADWDKVNEILDQQKATKKQLAEYNVWAKKLNKAIKKAEANSRDGAYPIVKKKEYEKFYKIYTHIMTEEQRESAEAWPHLPPPPPPPAPSAAPKVLKGKKNNGNMPPPPPPKKPESIKKSKSNNIINPVEITIKKNKSLELNGELVTLENLVNKVKKLNHHLPFEKRRKYVLASIQVEDNDHISFAKNIQQQLKRADIYNCTVGYNETKSKAGLPNNHFSLYSGLTLEEAKAKEKKIFNEDIDIDKKIDSINNSGGPWKVKVSSASYEFIDDDGNSSGKINLDPAEISKPPKSVYDYVKSLKNKEIEYIYNKQKVSYKEILKIIKENPNININSNVQNGKGYVKFWIEE